MLEYSDDIARMQTQLRPNINASSYVRLKISADGQIFEGTYIQARSSVVLAIWLAVGCGGLVRTRHEHV
jgi:hypothetical protein